MKTPHIDPTMREENPWQSGLSRRRFLGRAAAVAAGLSVVPRHVLGGPKFVAPSEKVNLAIIGCGGQGQANIRELFQHPDAQIIALADPAEFEDLHAFYFNSNAGRLPVKAGGGKTLRGQDPELQGGRLRGFPRDARQGEGDRCRSCARRRTTCMHTYA